MRIITVEKMDAKKNTKLEEVHLVVIKEKVAASKMFNPRRRRRNYFR